MKKLILSVVLLLALATAYAQNGNIVIFSEGGERFYAILNGERMNEAPATNIKVADLNQPGYKLKVIFEDKVIADLSKDIMVAPAEEAVYMIKRDKKGMYKVNWRSSTPIAQAPVYPASQVVYHWGAPQPAVVVASPTPQTVMVEETMTTTTTTGGTNPGVGGENVNMNVNVDGFGMSVNVNTNGGGYPATTGNTVISTTTTTTTTTSGTTNGTIVYAEPAPVATAAPCAYMDNGNYERARGSIESKSFEDSKMTLAKQIAKNNCMSANQVKGIMELFSFEESKLEFAKYAYPFCYEPNNYYLVNDAFDFESSIEDLDRHISSMR